MDGWIKMDKYYNRDKIGSAHAKYISKQAVSNMSNGRHVMQC